MNSVVTKTKNLFLGIGLMSFFGLFVSITLADTGILPTIVIDTATNDISIQGYAMNTSGEICLESGYTSQYATCIYSATTNQTTGVVQNTGVVVDTGAVNTGTTPTIDIVINSGTMLSEFGQALAWMYTNGITTFATETGYQPDLFLTREQASKLIGKAYQVLGYSDTVKNSTCSFKDTLGVTSVLLPYVQNACKRGLFKGNAEGNFLPLNTISKAEVMVVLIRMFEGKVSDERSTPRRNLYFKKGYAIGITNQINGSGFEALISRREVAVFLFRLKNIVTNEKLKMMSLNTISQIKPDATLSGTGANDVLLENLSAIADNVNAINDPELGAAIGWMYDNGLTSFNSIVDYKPFEVVSRLQSAKILHIFSQIYNLKTSTTGFVGNECTFTDLDQISNDFKLYVDNVCKAGLMKGASGKFNPEGNLLKSHFIVSLMRLFEGKRLDETITPWWKNYFQKAQELGIVGPADIITFENPVTRYEMALFLYRFKVKYQIINNLNTTRVANEVISTIAGTVTTGSDGMAEANVYLDTNLLKDGNFEIGYIDIMGNRYKIAKTDLVKYFTNSFVRYGDVFNMDTDAKIGTVSFIVNNGYVIESSVRITNGSYSVQPIEGVNTYYKIKKI